LVSCVARDSDSGEESHPMGVHPLGLIMYAPDGFMSAQLSTANRSPFQGSDPQNGTPDEYTEAASGYLAYSGPFDVKSPHWPVVLEDAVMLGLMQDWPLLCHRVIDHAASNHGERQIVKPLEPADGANFPTNWSTTDLGAGGVGADRR
jgi:hypothetical protein